MPRPKGSKIFSCPKCAERVVALPGEYGTCKACGARTKLTKTLLATQTPIARTPAATPVKKARETQPETKAEPKKRGPKPKIQVQETEEPKRRGRKPAIQAEAIEEPKRRGRPPISKLDATDEPPKRGRKATVQAAEEPVAPKKRGRPAAQKASPVIQNPRGVIRPPKRAYSR